MVLQDFQMPLTTFLHGLCCWAVDSLFIVVPGPGLSKRPLERAGYWVSAEILPDLFIILVISPQRQVCFCLQQPNLWLFGSPCSLKGMVLEVLRSFHPPGVVLNRWPPVGSGNALPSFGRDTGVTCIPESPAASGPMAALLVSSLSPLSTPLLISPGSPSLINHVPTVPRLKLLFWETQPRKNLKKRKTP